MIIPEHNLLFVHIPKTGGESITQLFIQVLHPNISYTTIKTLPDDIKAQYQLEASQKHRTATEYKNDLISEVWNNCYKFAVVRNSWDRVVSEYFWRQQIYTKHKIKLSNFTQFVRNLSKVYNNPNDFYFNHICPQISFITDGNEWLVDMVFSFDELYRVPKLIGEHIGIELMLEHRNSTKHLPYQSYYTDETKQIVEDIYKEDIQSFGFKF